jgi:hypothetical protein
MKFHLIWCAAIVLIAGALWPIHGQDPAPPKAPAHKTAAYDWLDIALEATAREHDRNTPRPTIGSRILGIVVTCMYDAWAAYDDKAVGTRLGGKLRRPAAERTEGNKAKAIAYAVYRALLFVFPEDEKWISEQMRAHGYDPAIIDTDPSTPSGVGNRAAQAVIAYRRNDGANQFGDEVGSDGKPYSDWTFYHCANTPTKLADADRWQPIPFSDGKGGTFAPGFLTPQWYRVKPCFLERSDMFRPPPPPTCDSDQVKR